jgi:hypothetical protein
MASVYVSNLVVNTGTTFTQTFSLENSDSSSNLNLSGYTISAQMRKHAGSSTYTTFNTSIVNAANGIIKIGLGTTSTASLKPGRYVYDVLIADNAGVITRVVEGSVLVREGVTR